MTVANEQVEDASNALKRAVERQNNAKIVGSVHMFMFGDGTGPGRAMIVHFIDDSYETWQNMMRLAEDLRLWADKFPTAPNEFTQKDEPEGSD